MGCDGVARSVPGLIFTVMGWVYVPFDAVKKRALTIPVAILLNNLIISLLCVVV